MELITEGTVGENNWQHNATINEYYCWKYALGVIKIHRQIIY